jgi:hypothetical protein
MIMSMFGDQQDHDDGKYDQDCLCTMVTYLLKLDGPCQASRCEPPFVQAMVTAVLSWRTPLFTGLTASRRLRESLSR